MAQDWTIHPNRDALGPNEPGRNGHYRARGDRVPQPTAQPCQARILIGADLADVADADGAVTFAGPDWWFALGAAYSFARHHHTTPTPSPFGFQSGRVWKWWDGTQTAASLLDDPDADDHIRRYLKSLFGPLDIEVCDLR